MTVFLMCALTLHLTASVFCFLLQTTSVILNNTQATLVMPAVNGHHISNFEHLLSEIKFQI